MNLSIILFNEDKSLSSKAEILLNSAIIVYSNADTDKLQILTDNKGKAGIYQWTHLESNKSYIGSAVDLSNRLSKYYSSSRLKETDNYISRAINLHGYSAFSLSILEYIDISNLSKDEARKFILEREQFYIDSLEPKYNILKTAGSLLGYKHSEETITKMFSRTHSAETKVKMSEAKLGENHPQGMLGKTHSAETLAKMSEVKGTLIYLYDTQGSLVNTFPSARKAAEYLNCTHQTIIRYALNGKIFKEQWLLSTSGLINKE